MDRVRQRVQRPRHGALQEAQVPACADQGTAARRSGQREQQGSGLLSGSSGWWQGLSLCCPAEHAEGGVAMWCDSGSLTAGQGSTAAKGGGQRSCRGRSCTAEPRSAFAHTCSCEGDGHVALATHSKCGVLAPSCHALPHTCPPPAAPPAWCRPPSTSATGAPLDPSHLQHGEGRGDKFSVDYIFDDALAAAGGTPATGVDETKWLAAFMRARRARQGVDWACAPFRSVFLLSLLQAAGRSVAMRCACLRPTRTQASLSLLCCADTSCCGIGTRRRASA